MYISEHEQGSSEWFADRLGVATASMFSDVMTPKQMKRAKSAYIYELAAEALTKEDQSSFTGNDHTDRGNELEDTARKWYEFMFDVEALEVGLCKPEIDSQYGCSPDSLIGDEGGLEIICPELKTHIKYFVNNEVPDEYKAQVYGCLFVTGRDWWDFVSYHTKAEPFVIRTTKDDEGYLKWKSAFEKILPEFLNDLNEMINKLKVK